MEGAVTDGVDQQRPFRVFVHDVEDVDHGPVRDLNPPAQEASLAQEAIPSSMAAITSNVRAAIVHAA